MRTVTKERLTAWLLWVLAGYCGYGLFYKLKLAVTNPDRLLHVGFDYWVYTLLSMAGFYLYIRTGKRVLSKKLSSKATSWFLIFSGVFAGMKTNLLWITMFPESSNITFADSIYVWMVVNLFVAIAALGAAIAVARKFSNSAGFRWMTLSFALTTGLLAILQIGTSLGFRDVDPVYALIGVAFLVFAYFFPAVALRFVNVAMMLATAGLALFAVAFSSTGRRFK